MIISVNYHLWEPCNMRCKFCFATFQDVKQSILPKGHLPKEKAIEVVQQLAEIGFEKITFAGGEPTLCPWLPDLIAVAKDAGMTTMIVTNGSDISDAFLEVNKHNLDWIALSIDSLNPETNILTGRSILGRIPLLSEHYYALVDRIKKYGYGLKINTVVSSKNYTESMNDFIRYAKPMRWKLLQVLPIVGQNDENIEDFKISDNQFQLFLDNHKNLSEITTIVPESNDQMKGSYAMVDPAGRFYDNTNGKHNYSKPILEIGSRLALQQVNYDIKKFIRRGGVYDWNIDKKHDGKNITISGMVASGKTTIGKLLAAKLNYSFVSLGEKIREEAKEKGLSIVEFQKLCFLNSNMDLEIDSKFSRECNSKTHTIIDYRMGFKFIENGFHVYLKVSSEVAKRRLEKDNRENETAHTLEERNELIRKQMENCYGFDYSDFNHYNLVVDVELFNSAEEIVCFIIEQFKKYQHGN